MSDGEKLLSPKEAHERKKAQLSPEKRAELEKQRENVKETVSKSGIFAELNRRDADGIVPKPIKASEVAERKKAYSKVAAAEEK